MYQLHFISYVIHETMGEHEVRSQCGMITFTVIVGNFCEM